MRVVDASTVVAALVDGGPAGDWAATYLEHGGLAAPHLLPVEVCNVLRRASLAGRLSEEVAVQALGDLLDLHVDLYPFEPFVHRVWALRHALTAYDAWYVALAETLGVELITLDERLARAPGLACSVRTPGEYRSPA